MSRASALPMASSTSSSLLINIIVIMMLANLEEKNALVTLGIVCCACSTFSGALRAAQYTLHGLVGIKTY